MKTNHFTYTGARTNEISFPLGGIGTGCIGLAGNGRLVDWEIFNRPSKGSTNGFSHFAIKAERDRKVVDARVLHGDLHPPYSGALKANRFGSFGFGPPREYLTGAPHFRDVVFRGEFPIAELSFVDDTFPGSIRMMAFNPFIPLNAEDSGIPAAFFEIIVTNTTGDALTYTLAGTLANPLPAHNIHRFNQAGGFSWLHLGTDGLVEEEPGYGTLALATDAPDVSHQSYWFRGRWFDNLEVFWHDFTAPGRLVDRHYDGAGNGNNGTLAAHLTLAPGETARVRFIIAWHFPNRTNDWNPAAAERAAELGVHNAWRNYYATHFADSADNARYSLAHWDRLERETRLFKDALFASSLPPAALDAVSANISLLKSPTVMRLEDGTFYGFEGCHPDSGCCEGSCTHVWNYAQALPFLFPALERSMREADFTHNQRPDGGMAFRLQLPLGIGPSSFRPCADGQFGGVMKVYRDWKICGDTAWLRELWPAVKKSIDFAWSPDNEDRWDAEQTGVLHGRQHHTLDMELFGPNAWLTGFYLGALKAGAEMADALGEAGAAAYRSLFVKGKTWADARLFNGEYYQQTIDLTDKALLEPFAVSSASMVGDVIDAYWDEEHGEIKYQIGEGCGIDQVLAQWHATLYGLGEIFDPVQTKSALAAIYKYNFKQPLTGFFNPCRVFGLNDEAGLVICDWPDGKAKPVIPVPYSQEAMHGFEYAAAIQMIQSGLAEEGMAVIAAVRARYDGERRNPWNEIECGSNYARSMASYALLNAFSGFTFDMIRGMVGFDPLIAEAEHFQCFWSLDSGWGTFSVTPEQVALDVLYGALELSVLALPFLSPQENVEVTYAGQTTRYTWSDGSLSFALPLILSPQHNVSIRRT